MDQTDKDQMLALARVDIADAIGALEVAVEQLDRSIEVASEAYLAIDARESETALEDRLRADASLTLTRLARERTQVLTQSPYFARCDLKFDDEPGRPYYIAKYSASDLGIYSWTSPVAALRFETPGEVSYLTPLDGQRTGQLMRRDQYRNAS
jgi:DNA helicase IV